MRAVASTKRRTKWKQRSPQHLAPSKSKMSSIAFRSAMQESNRLNLDLLRTLFYTNGNKHLTKWNWNFTIQVPHEIRSTKPAGSAGPTKYWSSNSICTLSYCGMDTGGVNKSDKPIAAKSYSKMAWIGVGISLLFGILWGNFSKQKKRPA